MGGSNPSLLKRSALLFLICFVFTFFYGEFELVKAVFYNMIGGISKVNISYQAVSLSVIKSVFGVLAAVTAGLAANGVTPHL